VQEAERERQNEIGRKGQAEQDRKNRTGRTELQGKEGQGRKAGTGQLRESVLKRKARAEQREWDSEIG
jgi:hypothetical protein